MASEKAVSPTPRDLAEDQWIRVPRNAIHPDRVDQINTMNQDISDLDLNESRPGTPSAVVDSAKHFLLKSKMERKAFNKPKRVEQLSRERSGKVLKQPSTTGQFRYLQCIRKDTISEYLKNRK
jgi:hypothetical protein